jgi:hypothetical protein
MWKKVLDSWLDLVEKYENRAGQKPDFCYWYNERPLSGVLNAAAWMTGGWGLEEFSSKRRNKGMKKVGRPDLWLGLGTEEAAIEAKIWWVAGTFAKAREKVGKMLAESRGQLEGLERWGRKGCQLVSVCFVVPCCKEPLEGDKGIKVLNELKEWAESQQMATAMHITKNTKVTKPNKRNYPGVLLLAKQEDFST